MPGQVGHVSRRQLRDGLPGRPRRAQHASRRQLQHGHARSPPDRARSTGPHHGIKDTEPRRRALWLSEGSTSAVSERMTYSATHPRQSAGGTNDLWMWRATRLRGLTPPTRRRTGSALRVGVHERRAHDPEAARPAAHVDLDLVALGDVRRQQGEPDADASRRRERPAGDLADRLARRASTTMCDRGIPRSSASSPRSTRRGPAARSASRASRPQNAGLSQPTAQPERAWTGRDRPATGPARAAGSPSRCAACRGPRARTARAQVGAAGEQRVPQPGRRRPSGGSSS